MLARDFDAILVGAFGDPRVPSNIHAREILLGMRFDMDLYANVRPVWLMDASLCPLKAVEPKDVDFVVIRENTEGVYCDLGGVFKQGTPDEIAIQEDVNTRKGVERIIRYAFEYCASSRKFDGSARRRVLMCDKSNAMTHAGGLWQRMFKEVAAEYPKIETQHMYVDALCLQMVRDPRPFDVIVTNNMFGDIITDLAAGLQGGLGIAASGNLHPGKTSMFEPVHGSAPPIAGKNIANPLGAIFTAAMMLAHLGMIRSSEKDRSRSARSGAPEEDNAGHRRQFRDERSRRVGRAQRCNLNPENTPFGVCLSPLVYVTLNPGSAMLDTLTLLPTLDEIREAQKLVYSVMQPTPQISWPLLNQRLDANVWVKHENHTPTGAFKARTAIAYAAELFKHATGIKGLITATRGNHGQSVALAGQRFNVPVTIVVPHGNCAEKNASMRAQGATLVEFGNDYQEAREHARKLAAEQSLHFVPGYHRDIVKGVASYWVELFEAIPDLDVVYVPIGMGSGICAGCAVRNGMGLEDKDRRSLLRGGAGLRAFFRRRKKD